MLHSYTSAHLARLYRHVAAVHRCRQVPGPPAAHVVAAQAFRQVLVLYVHVCSRQMQADRCRQADAGRQMQAGRCMHGCKGQTPTGMDMNSSMSESRCPCSMSDSRCPCSMSDSRCECVHCKSPCHPCTCIMERECGMLCTYLSAHTWTHSDTLFAAHPLSCTHPLLHHPKSINTPSSNGTDMACIYQLCVSTYYILQTTIIHTHTKARLTNHV